MDRKRALVLAVVFCAVVAVVAAKVTTGPSRSPHVAVTSGASAKAEDAELGSGEPTKVGTGRHTATALPKLLDIGAGHCIPCREMAPILEELKRDLAGKAEVVVIDLNEDPSAGDRYGIHLIPTQIFYDRGGKETLRHEGFMSKEEILAQLKALGAKINTGEAQNDG